MNVQVSLTSRVTLGHAERDTSKRLTFQWTTTIYTEYLAVMPTTTSVLRPSLEKHNETFETLLSLIPAKFYLARDDNNDEVGPIVSLFGLTHTAATGHIQVPQE